MKRVLYALFLLGLLSGCSPQKLSPTDVAAEKKAIESLVMNFWKAYEAKDLAAASKPFTSSGELLFFGTDSAEVVRTPGEWETQMKNDWELFQSVKFGEMRNVSTVVSSNGELGSILCEIPADITMGGQQSHFLFRFDGTVRKESGEWRFVQGMIAIATVGQSSAELAAKMKGQ